MLEYLLSVLSSVPLAVKISAHFNAAVSKASQSSNRVSADSKTLINFCLSVKFHFIKLETRQIGKTIVKLGTELLA